MDIEQLRADTPGTAHRAHLNNAGAALMSRRTLRAMTDQLELEATIGGYEAAARSADAIEATYTGMARLLGARRDEIALFDNSTHAWFAGFAAVPLGPGDRILTGRAEYGSNVLGYLQAAARTGAELVVIDNDETGQIDLTALENAVDERTKLIGLTYVPTFGGLVNPAAEVGRTARAAGVLYLLDATQAAGQFPVDVTDLGCDLLCGTGRKFLRGPRGTGFLYVRTDALDRLEPAVVEIGSATWDGHRGFSWQDGAQRFETWERSGVNLVGFGAAVEQALELGMGAIGQRAIALGTRLRDQLAALPKVTPYDQGARTGAIVTVAVDGVPAADVAAALAAADVNVTLTVPVDNPLDTEVRGVHPLVRLSPHYYNTEAELDRATEVIAAL
ncbi:MAG TPA: aminotransferase class V-fold PLP-dependent enzyme [Mycobacteriales bacterium]|jgi:selenocysteine lyase/cysteine desulfurase|nr:aminotransferase class V-fold PLP-dependent enzyme [Mycobacteriales bacterium]